MRLLLCLVAALAACFAHADERYFDSGGVRLRYVEQGTGSAVVLIHGFTGSLERPWLEGGLFENLAQEHRVIAFDLRGHGKSGKPHDPAAYGAIATDVIALMDHLGIARAHLVGYSLGGIIALKLITTDPLRIASAVIAGAAHRRHGGPAESDARELEHGPIPYRALIESTWPKDQPPPSDATLRARSQAILARGNDPLAHAALLRARDALVVRDRDLAAVHAPVLFVLGQYDPALARAQRSRALTPGAQIIVLPDATHPVADPRSLAHRPEFIADVRRFIDAQDASGSGAASSTPPKPSSAPSPRPPPPG